MSNIYCYLFSRATLNETFTAKYDGVLPRTPWVRPKFEIYNPKRDDEHPHPFHMPSPLPHPGCSPHSELVKEQLTAGCRIHAISLFLPKLSLKHVKMIRVDTTDCSESQASNIFNRLQRLCTKYYWRDWVCVYFNSVPRFLPLVQIISWSVPLLPDLTVTWK